MGSVPFILAGMLLVAGMMSPSFAHTTVEVGPYAIEAGWGVEPPIVGIRNDVVFKVIQPGETEGTYSGITSAFKNIDVTLAFGGATKQIDISSDPRPGYYFSPIIPTKTGSYEVELRGEIQGTTVNVKIPVEDVEPTAILDFPPTSGAGDTDTAALKSAVVSLQQDVSRLKSGEAEITTTNDGSSYDLAILGLSISGAAIVLAVVAMLKKNK